MKSEDGLSEQRAREDGSYDVLVLSPHLDDAALSLGGYLNRLTREGKRVLVVNVFAAEAPDDKDLHRSVRELHGKWRQAGGFEGSIMQHRRSEEEAACRRLGVEMIYLNFLDAAYRGYAEGEPLYIPLAKVFGKSHPDDNRLLMELTQAFRNLPEATTWILPMGMGRHVDHLLVREAAEAACAGELLYFEDFPYARDTFVRLKTRCRRLFTWRQNYRELIEDDVQAKIDAIRCHPSQIADVFPNPQALSDEVRDFTKDGERIWRRK